MKLSMTHVYAMFMTAFIVLGSHNYASTFTSNPPDNRTGSPGDGGVTCQNSCHGSFALNSGTGTFAVSITESGNPVSSYTPGVTYDIAVSLIETGISKFGFELTAEDDAGTNNIGTLIMGSGTALGSGYIKHSGDNSGAWTFQWTAPSAGAGNVTFYAAGVAANQNSSNSQDRVYTTSIAVSEAVTSACEGGALSIAGGNTNATVCSNLDPDIIQLENTGSTEEDYTYIITDNNDLIISATTNSMPDFNPFEGGTYHIYGVSHEGVLSLTQDENISTVSAVGCSELSSNFISITVIDTDGGAITTTTDLTQVNTCTGDGEDDIFNFATTSTAAASFAYVVTTDLGIILDISNNNTFNFEGAPVGTCLVWGVSYTGNLSISNGDDINTISTFSDGCSSLSTSFVTIVREDCSVNCIGVVDGGNVLTVTGESTITSCTGDGQSDLYSFGSTSIAPQDYAFIVTDSDSIVLDVYDGVNEIDFEGAPPGVCFIWGVSYTGTLTVSGGDAIPTISDYSTECSEISNTYVSITRTAIDGGNLEVIGGFSSFTACSGDDEVDQVSFISTSELVGDDYVLLLTDTDGVILEVLTVPNYDFSNFEPGNYLVYGLSYSGTLTTPLGESIFTELELSNECYDLSDTFVSITVDDCSENCEDEVDGGSVTTNDGEVAVSICVGDGENDFFIFNANSASSANYIFIVANQDGIIQSFSTDGFINFENNDPGASFVFGLSYTGDLLAMEGDNVLTLQSFSTICFDRSDEFVNITQLDCSAGTTGGQTSGGTTGTSTGGTTGPSTGGTTGASTGGTTTATTGGTTGGVTGGTTTAMTGGTTGTGDPCLGVVEGGSVTTISGETSVNTCTGDGVADSFIFANNSSVSGDNYAYVITDEGGSIIDISSSNTIDFEGADVGVCLVWGLSFTGALTATIGDDANLIENFSLGCSSLSSTFVTVTREDCSDPCADAVAAGTVSLSSGATSATTCTGDGIDDTFAFTNSSSSDANYTYVITTEEGIVLDFATSLFNFEGAPAGTCLVWGLSYTGTLTISVDDDATALTSYSSECSDLSSNFVTIIRENCTDPCDDTVDAGSITTSTGATTITTCTGDGAADDYSFTTSSSSSAEYIYVITDNDGEILDFSTGTANFEGAPVGTCLVWGLSYTGTLTAVPGDDATALDSFSSECSDLSAAAITVVRQDCSDPCDGTVDAGSITTSTGATTITTCTGDGEADEYSFSNSSSSGAEYIYIITDNDGEILDFSTGTANFEGAPVGTCLVWGLSYTGTLTAVPGDNATALANFSSECSDLSAAAITVVRQDCSDPCSTLALSFEQDCELTDATGSYIAIITVSGGTAPYFLTGAFNGEVDFDGDAVSFEVVDGETFVVNCVDAFGCEISINPEVEPCSKDLCEDLVLNFEQDCELADATGSYLAIITISGGTAPYFLTGAFNGEVDFDGDAVSFEVVDGETFVVNCVDASGCETSINPEVEPCSKDLCEDLVVNFDRDCDPVDLTGSYVVTIDVAGGTAPYTFTGDFAGTVDTDAGSVNFSVVDGEGYYVELIDASGCTFVIDQLEIDACSKDDCDDFVVNYTRDCDPVAIGGSYVVTIIVDGGTAPYTLTGDYSGTIDNDSGSVNFAVVDGEGYYVEIIDAAGCEFVIDELEAEACSKEGCDDFVVDYERNCDPVEATGAYEVSVVVAGGTAPYSISGSINEVLAEAGSISFFIIDGEGFAIDILDSSGECTFSIDESNIDPCTEEVAVSLLSFDGIVKQDGNHISWITANEQNNDYFTLYHSIDGETFKELTTISGQGTTTSSTDYAYTHKSAAAGSNYYYLAQTDFDGTSTNSWVINLNRKSNADASIAVSPIPATAVIDVAYFLPTEGKATISVYNVAGQRLVQSNFNAMEEGQTSLDISDLASGMYFVQIKQGETLVQARFIK